MKDQRIRISISALVAAVMFAWGIWLLGQARSTADYTRLRLSGKPVAPACQWFGLDEPSVAKFGWSQEPEHAWSDRRDAYLALNLPAMPRGGAIDMNVIALPGERATLSIDKGAPLSISSARPVRLPFSSRQAGPSVIRVHVENPKRPFGEDRRWLGIAIQNLRVVSTACPP